MEPSNTTTTKSAIKMLSSGELAAFCEQLSLILKSGASSAEGIRIMLEDAASPDEQAILTTMLDSMDIGYPLSYALKEAGVFPHYMIQMTLIAEETGTLDEVYTSLCAYYEREERTQSAMKHAFTFPLIMAGMMIVVVLVLLIKVMPIFNQVYVQLGTEMTGISRTLMHFGELLGRCGLPLILLAVLAFAFVLYLLFTEKGRKTAASLGSHIGPIRRIQDKLALCRFSEGMALVLSSGLSPERGLELTAELNENAALKPKLEQCQKLLEEGTDFADALREVDLFGSVYTRTVHVGQRTGSLDKAMRKIADLSEEEIDRTIDSYLSALEPALVVTLSVIVGIILLSVMLPLMGIMSTI